MYRLIYKGDRIAEPYRLDPSEITDEAVDIFVDVKFHIFNGSYTWTNGPQVEWKEWLNQITISPSQPIVPKWIYLRIFGLTASL